jgi:hypothetical protein
MRLNARCYCALPNGRPSLAATNVCSACAPLRVCVKKLLGPLLVVQVYGRKIKRIDEFVAGLRDANREA